MLVKLNNKPIEVMEDNEEEKEFSLVYCIVSTCGYVLVLCLMDYICYIFFGHSPFKFISWLWRLFV